MAMSNNPLEILWIGRATISEYQSVTNPDTYETTQELVPVVTDEPCRVSYTRETVTDIQSGASSVVQLIMLFIRPDIDIKAGSVIEVTQRGKTTKFKRSSKPAIYTNHQEVSLELYEDKA